MIFSYEQIPSHNNPVLPPETPLYRYLSVDKFKSLLERNELLFAKISSWADAQEGLRFNAMRVKEPDHHYSTRSLDSFYASCWSLQTEDKLLFGSPEHYQESVDELAKDGSDAMWRAYCQDRGVRIKTTLGKLEELFLASSLPTSALYSGRVYYDPFGSNWGNTLRHNHFMSVFLQKRVCFRSEAEFRFLFCATDDIPDTHINIPIPNLYNLVDEVLISPARRENKACSQNLVGMTQAIFPRDLNACGNTKNGQQFCRISQLYGNVEWPNW